MQNDIFRGLEVFAGILLPLILGTVASFAKVARYGWQGFKHFLGNLVVSCFTGVVVFWSLDLCQFPPTVDAAITSASAYMSVSILDALTRRTEREIKYRGAADVPAEKPDKDEQEAK